MISLEAYLSILNYDGIGRPSVPVIIWLPPVRATEPPQTTEPPAETVRKVRREGWRQKVQSEFADWVAGRSPTYPDYGYTRSELLTHLERQFVKGMTWRNYAGHLPYRAKRRMWVVDHIVPKRLFGRDEIRSAYALANLRPMWIEDNFRKGSKRQHLL